jgi:hypothetical protein
MLALLCSVLAVVALQQLIAALYAQQAQLFLDDWKESRSQGASFVPDTRAWHVADYAASRAVLWPLLPHADDLQRWGQILAWGEGDDQSVQYARWETALTQYRAAMDVRPQWALGWFGLGNMKLRLGQFDSELLHALQQTERYAGTRLYLLQPLAETGLRYWAELDLATRQAIIRAIQRTVDVSPAAARRLEARAVAVGQRHIFCAVIAPAVQQARALCVPQD